MNALIGDHYVGIETGGVFVKGDDAVNPLSTQFVVCRCLASGIAAGL